MDAVERKSFSEMSCSVAQCLEVVGEWWSLLIIRDALLGVTRFDDFQQRLGISRNILGDRLSRLVAEGVLEKVAYQEHPLRYDYRLTPKGFDLAPVVTAMREWGDSHAAPEGPRVRLVHEECGAEAHLAYRCDVCERPVDRGELRAVPGPGYQGGILPDSEAVPAWR